MRTLLTMEFFAYCQSGRQKFTEMSGFTAEGNLEPGKCACSNHNGPFWLFVYFYIP